MKNVIQMYNTIYYIS